MSTKKVVRLEKHEAAQEEKKLSARRRIGLMAVLAAALAGPIAAAPIEDPRRPRERAAWTPTPTGHGKRGRQGAGNLNSGPSAGALEGPERAEKPTVFLVGGAKPDTNLYVRRIKTGLGEDDQVYEFGNRLKDRKRELEALMRDLGIPVSHRQVKRILRGFMPPRLVAWLDAKKELEARAAAGGEA